MTGGSFSGASFVARYRTAKHKQQEKERGGEGDKSGMKGKENGLEAGYDCNNEFLIVGVPTKTIR